MYICVCVSNLPFVDTSQSRFPIHFFILRLKRNLPLIQMSGPPLSVQPSLPSGFSYVTRQFLLRVLTTSILLMGRFLRIGSQTLLLSGKPKRCIVSHSYLIRPRKRYTKKQLNGGIVTVIVYSGGETTNI